MAKQKTMKGIFCKNGYWYAYIDNEQKYYGKGSKGRELAEAAKAKQTVKQYENREIEAGLKVKRDKFKTFKKLCNWYMLLPSVQKQKSYNRKIGASAHLIEFFGNKPLRTLEVDDQENYRQRGLQQGAMESTINVEISLFRRIYHQAAKRKKIMPELMPGEFVIEKYKNPRRRITDDEFNALLEASGPDFQDFLICGYESAMRAWEIARLTVSQVKLDIRHISGNTLDYIDLGIFDTKNKTRRTVPVSQRLKEILKRRMQGLNADDYVFTYKGKKYGRSRIRDSMMLTCKKAEILYGDKTLDRKGYRKGIVFHCLRNTRITKWIKQGWSDEIIRRASGHQSLEAYRDYVKLEEADIMCLVKGQGSQLDKNVTKRDKIGVNP